MSRIYFTLKKNPVPKLVAQYDGRSEETAIHLVPAVIDAHINGKPLLFEEQVALAEKYLRSLLFPPRQIINNTMNTKDIEEIASKITKIFLFETSEQSWRFTNGKQKVIDTLTILTQHHEAEVRAIREELESWGGMGWSADDYALEVKQLIQALTPTTSDKQ